MIEIHHGIYDSDLGTFKYRNSKNEIDFPQALKQYIREKVKQYAKKYAWKRLVEFTFGNDDEAFSNNSMWAITVVHPRDHFIRKVGAEIVRGRLKRVTGQLIHLKRLPYRSSEMPCGIFFEQKIKEGS